MHLPPAMIPYSSLKSVQSNEENLAGDWVMPAKPIEVIVKYGLVLWVWELTHS